MDALAMSVAGGPRNRWRVSRRELDDAFPTVVRYLGIGLIVFWSGAALYGVEVPESLLIAATGMVLYKTVRGSNGEER